MTHREMCLWYDNVFKHPGDISRCMEKLTEEYLELCDDPTDPMEMADCAIVLYHLAHRQGYDLDELIVAKHEKNVVRWLQGGWPKPTRRVE